MDNKRIVIVQYRLLHYRVELFERLRVSCRQAGFDLDVVHGQPSSAEAIRADTGELEWGMRVNNLYRSVRGVELVWQPMGEACRNADLVILMQENRILSNYPYLLGFGGRNCRVAFWGHGRNFQSKIPNGLRERWKRWWLGRVDWWFAYTDMTRDILSASGYPDERTTVLNNAIDNSAFAADISSVTDEEVQSLRQKVGATPQTVLGIYCGSLYVDKKLELLVEACEKVYRRHPSFRMVVLGDGPSRDILLAAASRPWLSWVGTKRGREKAAWFKASQIYLSPGAVGLHVLDSFVAETPILTTKDAAHGPEIAYLQDGVNGIVVEGGVDAYAEAVCRLVDDEALRRRLVDKGRECAHHFTLDNMVSNFVAGMQGCLAKPRIRA